MAMPGDAITTILGLNPLHLWTMRDGPTFSDEVSSGNLPLTAGTGCTPAGWGQIYGYRFNGGPTTVAPTFDGSANAKATASGSPIGSTLNGASPFPGFAVFAYMESTQYKNVSGQNTIYAEGGGSGSNRLSLFIANTQPKLAFHANAGSTTTFSPPSNSAGIFGGSSPQGPRKGGQLVGVSVDTSGNVWFYRNGLFTPTPSNSTFPTSVAWTNTGLTTAVGFDPANTSNSWLGALSWVCVFPAYITPSQFYTIYAAISPEPTNGNRWNISRSGRMFPNSQFWSATLPANAPVDPNSTAIMAQWMNYNNVVHSLSVAQGVNVPAFDLDHTGRAATQGARLSFYGSLDENVGVRNAPIPDTFDCEYAQPGNKQSDAISAGAQPSTGRSWDLFHTAMISGPRTARSPLWSAYINTSGASTVSGSLAAGFYSYVVTALTASGTESAFDGSNGADIETHLTATGQITLTMFHNLGGTHPPVQYRVYRRGPYTVSTSNTSWTDYGLLTTLGDGVTTGGGIFPDSNTSATFTDNGTFGTPNQSIQPLIVYDQSPTSNSWTPTVTSPTAAGANTSGQKLLSIANMYQTFGSATSRGGIGVGTVLTIGTGGTQETATVADALNMSTVQLVSPLSFPHSPGESITHQGNLWGGNGDEFESDAAALGGGSSWDWWVNAVSNPPFQDTNSVLNGQSATKKPGAAGVIMVDETAASFTGTITIGSLNTITGTTTPPNSLQVGGVVAGSNIATPLKVTSFTPGSTWTAVLAGNASGAVPNGSFYVGLIQHPIGFEFPKANQGGTNASRRWPALSHDGSNTTGTNVTVEGMRFRLPATFNEADSLIPYSSIPQTAVAQMAYVIACRDYGIYDHDSGPAGGGPYLEDTPQTGREEWPAILAGQDIDAALFNGYSSFTASTVMGQDTLTGLATGASFPAGVVVGAFVTGPGVPTQTHVESIDTVNGIATLDQTLESTMTNVTFYTGPMMNLQVLAPFRFGTKVRVDGIVVATIAAGTPNITNLSVPTFLTPGLLLSGTGIQHDTSVLSVNGSTAIMSQNATASGSMTLSYGRRSNRTDAGTFNTPGFQQLSPY